MQRVIYALFALFLSLPSLVNAQENKIVGTWWNNDQTAHIRIFQATNGKFYGKIEWMEHPEKLDINNPDESKRNQPRMGLQILNGFKYDQAKNQWNSGTIYDPDNGKTYDCFMWFEDDPDLLILKGYVMGMKFIGRETTWKKVK
jgi:uncharacterized protein (DUF2147 family)